MCHMEYSKVKLRKDTKLEDKLKKEFMSFIKINII